MPMPEEVFKRPGGLVLCGGKSRRMGRDKASLPFGPETLLQRVVRQLTSQTCPIVVVAAENQILPSLPDDVRVVCDPVHGRGPWQGVSAGLLALHSRAEFAYVTTCDSPFLVPGWIQRLQELIGDHACAVPRIHGHLQPLSALYRVNLRPLIDDLLADETARPHALFERVATRFIVESELAEIDPVFATLRNINSPEEHRRALEDAGFTPI
jgi:molybdopterin-guanine dinucleotide biosynthesis protein A